MKMTGAHENMASRLWRKDASLWRAAKHDATITAGLGWLDCIDWMHARADALNDWAARAGDEFDRVILLGMGGASLAPKVFASLFAPASRGLALQIIDTTNPVDIARVADGDLRGCLFIVASKSGETIETLDLYAFFRAQLAARVANPDAHFVIITDAGSKLHQLGEKFRVKKIFTGAGDIGGRYSALSYFGMAPAALLGVDVAEILNRARIFCETTKSDSPSENDALALGMFLGRAALAGRDKLMLLLPEKLNAFGMWIEQLIAESCGKDGNGILPSPIANEHEHECNGDDRISVRINTSKTETNTGDTDYALQFDQPLQIGAEFFRWEFATAIAAAYLRVHPFDQPDVLQAKQNTRAHLKEHAPLASSAAKARDQYELHYRENCAENDAAIIADFCAHLAPPKYLALLAYLPQDCAALLQTLRADAARASGVAVTLGFGPRYLHSTGQFHKGGPRTGRFIQFIADDGGGENVPGRDYTFGALHRAQADGDFAALRENGAVVLRVNLKADRLHALTAFSSAFTAHCAPQKKP